MSGTRHLSRLDGRRGIQIRTAVVAIALQDSVADIRRIFHSRTPVVCVHRPAMRSQRGRFVGNGRIGRGLDGVFDRTGCVALLTTTFLTGGRPRLVVDSKRPSIGEAPRGCRAHTAHLWYLHVILYQLAKVIKDTWCVERTVPSRVSVGFSALLFLFSRQILQMFGTGPSPTWMGCCS